MHPDPRKIGVVAATELGSAIRTKSFLIMLLLLPVIMGGSILLQLVVAKRVDTRPRKVGVIDHTGDLYPAIETAAATYNAQSVDPAGKATRPRIELSKIKSGTDGEPSAGPGTFGPDSARRPRRVSGDSGRDGRAPDHGAALGSDAGISL